MSEVERDPHDAKPRHPPATLRVVGVRAREIDGDRRRVGVSGSPRRRARLASAWRSPLDRELDVVCGKVIGVGSGDAADVCASVGDPDRFGPVFERHHRVVWTYLARLGGPEVADDLAGEVFVTGPRREAGRSAPASRLHVSRARVG